MSHTLFSLLAFILIFAGAFAGLVCGFIYVKRKNAHGRSLSPSHPPKPTGNPLDKIDKSASFADMGTEGDPDVLTSQMHQQDNKYTHR